MEYREEDPYEFDMPQSEDDGVSPVSREVSRSMIKMEDGAATADLVVENSPKRVQHRKFRTINNKGSKKVDSEVRLANEEASGHMQRTGKYKNMFSEQMAKSSARKQDSEEGQSSQPNYYLLSNSVSEDR